MLVAAAPEDAAAQLTVEDFAGAYVGENAQGYFGPLATVLTASLNSGFVGPVPASRGFSFRLGALTPIAPIGNSLRTFAATTDPGFSPQATRDVPTILGDPDPVIVEGDGGSGYIFPAGVALTRVAVALPQLTVGALGTEATVRWAGLSTNEALGDLSLLGLGLRHRISGYLPHLPVDLAVGGMYNSLKLGNTMDVKAILVNVSASRRVSWFDVYGGLGWENSSMELAYDSDRDESGRVRIDLDGVNGIRATAGLGLSLPVIAVNADVSVGSQTIFGLGVSLGLRY